MDGLTIFQRIADSFVKNMIVEDRYMLILQGLLTTVLITVLASILGTILGGLVCWMKMRGGKVLKKIAKVYVDVMRGTPVLVLLHHKREVARVGIKPAAGGILLPGQGMPEPRRIRF